MAKKRKSRGLGDDIAKITEATGIKKAVELFTEATGIDCGCSERQEKLNKIFPKTNCLEQKEYEYLKANLDYDKETGRLSKRISGVVKLEIEKIYNRVFNMRNFKFGTCPTCASRNKQALKNLVEVMETYK